MFPRSARRSWRSTSLSSAGALRCSPAGKATVGLPDDPELLEQVAGVEIIRTRAPEFSLFYGGRGKRDPGRPAQRGARSHGRLHPKAWLVPDSQVLWYPFAVRAAMRRARTARWDAVVATHSPRLPSSSRTRSPPAGEFPMSRISAIRGPHTTLPSTGRRRSPSSSGGSRQE